MSGKIEFIEKLDIDKVKLWEGNPRFNDEAAERLAEILRVHGFINPIILDKNYIVRAGNTRVKAAKLAGIKCVPALIVDFKDEAHAIAYSLSDNKSTEWAQWDYQGLKEIISELESLDFDLMKTGFDANEIEKILTYEEMFGDDEEYLRENYEEPDKDKEVCPYCGRPL